MKTDPLTIPRGGATTAWRAETAVMPSQAPVHTVPPAHASLIPAEAPAKPAGAGAHARPVIDIRHIHRIFESDAGLAHILHDVSLTVRPGEFVAITGPSGSGKSTLMNILGCLDTPTSGTYLLEGLNVAELTDDELAEVRALRIGFVFQSFNLLPRMSVLDNVMLPLAYTDVPRREREMRAVHALRAVGLPVDHYDHRTNELSGGQMQRVAIARALVNDPAIILADEPTGNLDSVTGRQVMETFHALKRAGKTIVLITHDASVAAEADRAVQIRDGRVYEGAYVPVSAANDTVNTMPAGDAVTENSAPAGIGAADFSSVGDAQSSIIVPGGAL